MNKYFKILGLNINASELDLKVAFKKRAFETHPDKGGSAEEFAKVKKAYKKLCEVINCNPYDFEILKRESQSRVSEPPPNKKFNLKKFNKQFERFRPKDHGYDLKNLPETREIDYAKCVIKYTEPDLIYTSSNYTTLDGGTPTDYTAPFNSKIKYTDCARAFSKPVEETEIIDRDINEWKSLQKTIQERDKPITLSNFEKEQYEFHQNLQKTMEAKRIEDYKHFCKTNKKIAKRINQKFLKM